MDRNAYNAAKIDDGNRSLSARRAWIEIDTGHGGCAAARVALRKESVDRNQRRDGLSGKLRGRSPQGERG